MATLLDVLLKNSGSLAGSINWMDLGKTLGVAALTAVGTALAAYAAGGSAGGLAPILAMVAAAVIDLAHRYSTNNAPATPSTPVTPSK